MMVNGCCSYPLPKSISVLLKLSDKVVLVFKQVGYAPATELYMLHSSLKCSNLVRLLSVSNSTIEFTLNKYSSGCFFNG